METISYNEFWVINNHNTSPSLSVLHLPPRLPERGRARSGTTSPRWHKQIPKRGRHYCGYSKKLTVLCCAGSGHFWLWPNKLIQCEEYRLLKDRDNRVQPLIVKKQSAGTNWHTVSSLLSHYPVMK